MLYCLFNSLQTIYLNKKLNEAMPGLTAKVFRTFNASTTLQEQLDKLTVGQCTHTRNAVGAKVLAQFLASSYATIPVRWTGEAEPRLELAE